MNIYRREFSVKCPNNDESIWYELELQADVMVMVEVIAAATDMFTEGYHEDIADQLHKELGHKQTIRAYHHGVRIETRRGFE